MAEIRKKVLKEYFEKILSGKKNFEVRIADLVIDFLESQSWPIDIQTEV